MAESDLIINKSQLATYIQLQRAELEMRSGQDKQAEQRMNQLKKIQPDNHVVVMEHARMKIQMGQASQARALLEDYLAFRQGDPNVYRLLSHASNASGDIVKSHTYMAEYNLIVGDVSGAIGHLEAALRNPITSYHEEAAIRAKLKSLREQSDKPGYGEPGKTKN